MFSNKWMQLWHRHGPTRIWLYTLVTSIVVIRKSIVHSWIQLLWHRHGPNRIIWWDPIRASSSPGAYYFDFYNIKLFAFITLTLTLTLRNFFRLLLSAFIARSCIFGKTTVRVQLLWNCIGLLPSAVGRGIRLIISDPYNLTAAVS